MHPSIICQLDGRVDYGCSWYWAILTPTCFSDLSKVIQDRLPLTGTRSSCSSSSHIFVLTYLTILRPPVTTNHFARNVFSLPPPEILMSMLSYHSFFFSLANMLLFPACILPSLCCLFMVVALWQFQDIPTFLLHKLQCLLSWHNPAQLTPLSSRLFVVFYHFAPSQSKPLELPINGLLYKLKNRPVGILLLLLTLQVLKSDIEFVKEKCK